LVKKKKKLKFYAIEGINSSTIKPRKDAIFIFDAINIAQYYLCDNIAKEKIHAILILQTFVGQYSWFIVILPNCSDKSHFVRPECSTYMLAKCDNACKGEQLFFLLYQTLYIRRNQI